MLFMHSIKGVESSVAGLQAPNQQKNTPPNKNSKSAPKKGILSLLFSSLRLVTIQLPTWSSVISCGYRPNKESNSRIFWQNLLGELRSIWCRAMLCSSGLLAVVAFALQVGMVSRGTGKARFSTCSSYTRTIWGALWPNFIRRARKTECDVHGLLESNQQLPV